MRYNDSVGERFERGHRGLVAERPNGEVPYRTAGDVPASSVMQEVPCLLPNRSLQHAAALMASWRVRELPVQLDGVLLGIITERDLEPFRGHFEWTLVEHAMTRDPIVVGPDTLAATVAGLLLQHDLNGVPVVQSGYLVGMVRRTDLLKVLAREEIANRATLP